MRTISRDELNRTKYPKTISASFSSARAITPDFNCNKRTEDKQTGETTNSKIWCDASDDGVSDKITVDSQSDDPVVVEEMNEKLRKLKKRVTTKRKFGRETRKEKGLSENVRVEREIGMSGQCTSYGVKIR
jgi:3-oxoacyl-ACP reductase-like protein